MHRTCTLVLDAGFWHWLDSTLALSGLFSPTLSAGPSGLGRPLHSPYATIPSGFTVGPVRGIPTSCAANGAGTAPVFGRPLVQLALAALKPLVSGRSVQLAVRLHLARFI